eukprot:602978-Rhodomonas_salina.4
MSQSRCPMLLRAPYALSGTAVRLCITAVGLCCYAVPGTDLYHDAAVILLRIRYAYTVLTFCIRLPFSPA